MKSNIFASILKLEGAVSQIHSSRTKPTRAAPSMTPPRKDKAPIQRSRTRNGERFRAWSDLGAITVQEIITETDASSLNKPGDWIQGSSEFQRMDKGRSLKANDARTEFTDPVDGRGVSPSDLT